MASYKIVILESAKAEFQKIPFPIRRQVNQQLFRLKDDAHPRGHVQFAENKFGISVHGWWIYYSVEDDAKVLVITAFIS